MIKKSKETLLKYGQQIVEEDSWSQKVVSFLYKLFIGEKGVEPQINRAIVQNTYFQITEIIHIVVLFTVFSSTNNNYYSIIQSSIGGCFFLICLIPRVSKKHIIFQINFVLYFLITACSSVATIIIFQNFSIFTFYCGQIAAFYSKQQQDSYTSLSICESVYNMYIMEIACELGLIALRLVYLFINFKAYIVAKEKSDEEEKKKRRRDRYNELLMKRTTYNQKRKV